MLSNVDRRTGGHCKSPEFGVDPAHTGGRPPSPTTGVRAVADGGWFLDQLQPLGGLNVSLYQEFLVSDEVSAAPARRAIGAEASPTAAWNASRSTRRCRPASRRVCARRNTNAVCATKRSINSSGVGSATKAVPR